MKKTFINPSLLSLRYTFNANLVLLINILDPTAGEPLSVSSPSIITNPLIVWGDILFSNKSKIKVLDVGANTPPFKYILQ